jgi:hypothetical protein
VIVTAKPYRFDRLSFPDIFSFWRSPPTLAAEQHPVTASQACSSLPASHPLCALNRRCAISRFLREQMDSLHQKIHFSCRVFPLLLGFRKAYSDLSYKAEKSHKHRLSRNIVTTEPCPLFLLIYAYINSLRTANVMFVDKTLRKKIICSSEPFIP